MSRTDGKFPEYAKLTIDPKNWPNKYWETSRACKVCEYRWPYVPLFYRSPCCGADTEVIEEPPNLRWPEAISQLIYSRFERYYEEYNEGVPDDQLDWEDVKTDGEFDEEKAAVEVDALLKDAQTGT